MTFALGKVLYESGGQMEHIYFPTTSVVSLLYTMEDGTTAEMGLAGNDGVVGVTLFLGGDTTPNRAVVQVAGEAYSRGQISILDRKGLEATTCECYGIVREELDRLFRAVGS